MGRHNFNFHLEHLQASIVKCILGNSAKEQYSKGKISKAILEKYAEALKDLSLWYNSQEKPTHPNLSQEQAEAYALYYTPINFVKILWVLSQISLNQSKDDLTVLDFGCGPGTAILALVSLLNPNGKFIGVDNSVEMLRLAEKLSLSMFPEINNRVSFSDSLENKECFDLIFLSNVINEVNQNQREDLFFKLIQKLNINGRIILVEPALSFTSRNAMAWRDKIISSYPDLVPIFPCTHKAECPMLRESKTDWCHMTLDWEEPKLVKQLDELTGFNKHRIKFSAFVFQKAGELLPGYRVVSSLKKNKIGWSSILCGDSYYGNTSLWRRNRSPKNKSFEKINLYDRIAIEPKLSSELIEKNSVVNVIGA